MSEVTCVRCGHIWNPSGGRPARCARCKASNWDKRPKWRRGRQPATSAEMLVGQVIYADLLNELRADFPDLMPKTVTKRRPSRKARTPVKRQPVRADDAGAILAEVYIDTAVRTEHLTTVAGSAECASTTQDTVCTAEVSPADHGKGGAHRDISTGKVRTKPVQCAPDAKVRTSAHRDTDKVRTECAPVTENSVRTDDPTTVAGCAVPVRTDDSNKVRTECAPVKQDAVRTDTPAPLCEACRKLLRKNKKLPKDCQDCAEIAQNGP